MNQKYDLVTLFCLIDDFCKSFETTRKNIFLEHVENKKLKKPTRSPGLSLSEIVTILILFHFSGYRTFKYYYLFYVSTTLKNDFPNLLSYSRFVQLMSFYDKILLNFCSLTTKEKK